MKLYYYPRSTYSQKVLIALYEKQIPFDGVIVYPGDPADRAQLDKLTPMSKVPVLVLDDGWKIPESSIIIEYLDRQGSGPTLIPEDPDAARQTRFHDRIADLYVTESLFMIARESDAERVAKARARLDTMLAGIDGHLSKGRTWLMGDRFTLADCSMLAPLAHYRRTYSLDRWKAVAAYLARGLERPSVARVVRDDEAYVVKAAS